jgi:hypothetical protein
MNDPIYIDAEATAEIERLERENKTLLHCLKQIINDLPANRDWLNPDIERLAKQAIANAKD